MTGSKARWRAVLLTGIGLLAGLLPVQMANADSGKGNDRREERHEREQRGKKKDDDRPVIANKAQGVERYNPFIDGNRVVFTQVQRRNGATTASIWARDLTTGRESLVADVGTGEPMPVTSADWTAWSEMGPGQPGTSLVRARANSGGAVVDVFTTAYDGFGSGGEADELLSVDLSGSRLVTTNGLRPPGEGKQLVRFTLPSTQPTFVDVMTTAAGPTFSGAEPGVAQSGATSVITLGNSTLFSVVDGAGAVVAAPAADTFFGDGCIAGFGQAVPAIDGARVAVPGFCFEPNRGYSAAIITCTLPCATVDPVFVGDNIGFDLGLSPRLTVRGDAAYFSVGNGVSGSTIYSVDLARRGSPVEVRRSAGAIGPRVSVSGNRLVWDETIVKGGVQTSDVYVMDLATGATTALRPNGRDVVVTAPTGPIRLNPDVRGNQLAYAEIARDGTSAGIWQRALTGGTPALWSSVATDGSVPRLGTGWTAWTTRSPDLNVERVVATDRPGGALVDVYQTDLHPTFELFPGQPTRVLPVSLDVSGNRVATLGWTLRDQFGFASVQSMLFSTDLPDGALTPLTPFDPNSFFSPNLLGPPRTEGTTTVVVDQSVFPRSIHLFEADGTERNVPTLVDATLSPCFPQAYDVTATKLVVFQNCFFTGLAYLTSCTLPCANGFDQQRALLDPNGNAMQIQSLTASGSQVAMTRLGQFNAGRYGTRFGGTTEVIVTDLTGTRAPVVLTNESGVVSEPRIDGTSVVWSVDRYEGARTGTITIYDLRRSRVSSTL